MHAAGVPAVAGGFQNWTMTGFDFSVSGSSQFADFESPDATAVARCAILREAKEFVVKLQDSTSRPSALLVAVDDRTSGVFHPWASQFGCEIQPECIVLIRCGTGKQPPEIVAVKDRRIGELSFEQSGNGRPSRGKVFSVIEADGVGAERLGKHEVLVSEFENVWVREMKGFFEDDMLVGPGKGVVAGGEADLAAV